MNLKIVFKNGDIEDRGDVACLADVRAMSHECKKMVAYIEVSSPAPIADLDKRYHQMLMQSFIRNHLDPLRPLVGRFSLEQSWGVIYCVTCIIRYAWEDRRIMKNTMAWHEKGGLSPDESIVVGSFVKYGKQLQYINYGNSNHSHIDGGTPLRGIVERSKNLLAIATKEPGMVYKIGDSFRTNMRFNKLKGPRINSCREQGYSCTPAIIKPIEEIIEEINLPVDISEEPTYREGMFI